MVLSRIPLHRVYAVATGAPVTSVTEAGAAPVRVVAAVIANPRRSLFFVGRRSRGRYVNTWEFPGGKSELGESPADTLQRELREEGVVVPNGIITLGPVLATVRYHDATTTPFELTHYLVDCHSGAVNTQPPSTSPSHTEFRWRSWWGLRDLPVCELSPGMAALLSLFPDFPEIR